jgi:hypothetical protein
VLESVAQALSSPAALPSAGHLTPTQARIELMLQLLV